MHRILLIAVAVLSVGGVVGQGVWNPTGPDDITAAMLWIIASNLAVGIVVSLQTNPFPTTWKTVGRRFKSDTWTRRNWAPAGYSMAAQAALGVVLALVFAVSATDDYGFSQPFIDGVFLTLFASVVAAVAILGGFLACALVIWPLVTIVSYLLQHIAGRTGAKVDLGGALLSGILLTMVGTITFGAVAVPTPSSSGFSALNLLPLLGGLLFDFDANGDVNQPLAWASRVFLVALLALVVVNVTLSSRRAGLKNEKRRAAADDVLDEAFHERMKRENG
jgi:hypothetical protein